MSDPFDELRRKREASDAQRQAGARRDEQDKDRTRAHVLQVLGKHRVMIERVLEKLRAAQYPHSQLNTPAIDYPVRPDPERDLWRPAWTISHTAGRAPGTERDLAGWGRAIIDVSVTLDFDEDWQPLLTCWTQHGEKTCHLSEADLVRTLLDLHGKQ